MPQRDRDPLRRQLRPQRGEHRSAHAWHPRTRADAAPLPHLLTADELAAARLIKLDVEGSEAAAVRAAPHLPRLRDASELVIEVTSSAAGQAAPTGRTRVSHKPSMSSSDAFSGMAVNSFGSGATTSCKRSTPVWPGFGTGQTKREVTTSETKHCVLIRRRLPIYFLFCWTAPAATWRRRKSRAIWLW
ncbi:hypothetical protein [Streptomyces sp. NPDC004976]